MRSGTVGHFARKNQLDLLHIFLLYDSSDYPSFFLPIFSEMAGTGLSRVRLFFSMYILILQLTFGKTIGSEARCEFPKTTLRTFIQVKNTLLYAVNFHFR